MSWRSLSVPAGGVLCLVGEWVSGALTRVVVGGRQWSKGGRSSGGRRAEWWSKGVVVEGSGGRRESRSEGVAVGGSGGR
jgi:hypothetical protein